MKESRIPESDDRYWISLSYKALLVRYRNSSQKVMNVAGYGPAGGARAWTGDHSFSVLSAGSCLLLSVD